MARIFIDGFEAGDLALWTAVGETGKISGTVIEGFKGIYSLNLNWNNRANKRTFASACAQLNVAWKIYINTINGTSIMNFVDSSNVVIASVCINTTSGKLELRRGGGTGELLATGTTVLNTAVTYLFEALLIPLNSGGTFTVRVNGVQEVTYSGDTTNGAESDIKAIIVGAHAAGGTSPNSYVDDVVVDDASWIGNTYIQKSQVSGAGTTAQWDPSAGANYACVDEIPASDTDYVSTNVTDEIDTYATGNLTGAINSVKCVQLQGRIAYEGTPTPAHVQFGVRSNGTDYFSGDLTPGLTFAAFSRMLEQNPDGPAAWTESTVNAMEIGVKATA